MTGWVTTPTFTGATATQVVIEVLAVKNNNNIGWNGGTKQEMKCYANWGETDTALEIWVVDHDLLSWTVGDFFRIDSTFENAHIYTMSLVALNLLLQIFI